MTSLYTMPFFEVYYLSVYFIKYGSENHTIIPLIYCEIFFKKEGVLKTENKKIETLNCIVR